MPSAAMPWVASRPAVPSLTKLFRLPPVPCMYGAIGQPRFGMASEPSSCSFGTVKTKLKESKRWMIGRPLASNWNMPVPAPENGGAPLWNWGAEKLPVNTQ
jgi:hypothetical protein